MNNYKTKRVLLTFCLMLFTVTIWGCNIQLEIIGNKARYAIGDEVKVLIDVKLQHRQCDVTINDTKFKCEGLKLVGKSEWIKLPNGHFQCEVVARVTKTKNNISKLVAERVCDRDGGCGQVFVPI